MSSKLTRRTALGVSGAMLGAVAFSEDGLWRSARAEDKVTIGTVGGSWGEAVKKSFVDRADLPGAQKDGILFDYAIDSVLSGKVIASCGRPNHTAVVVNASPGAQIGESGCAEPYDLEVVTNYGDIVDAAKLPVAPGAKASHWASFVLMMFAPVYNTKLATKPTSIKDLWSSKYKGKVGVPDYAWNGIDFLHAANKVFGGTEDNITPGIEAMAELVKKNQGVIIQNTDMGMKAFAREEIVIMPFWNGRVFTLREQNVPVDIAYVPGTIRLGTGIVISKGTSQGKAANKIVNASLDPGNQVLFTRAAGYPPSNRKAKLPPELAERAVTEADLANVVDLDMLKINKYRAAYQERWNREVIG